MLARRNVWLHLIADVGSLHIYRCGNKAQLETLFPFSARAWKLLFCPTVFSKLSSLHPYILEVLIAKLWCECHTYFLHGSFKKEKKINLQVYGECLVQNEWVVTNRLNSLSPLLIYLNLPFNFYMLCLCASYLCPILTCTEARHLRFWSLSLAQ